MPNTERERKFLITAPPTDLARHPHHLIRQGYLVISPDGSQARLRQITRGRRTEYLLTIKHPSKRSKGARTEIELPLPKNHFTQLWPLTKNQRLEKTRYNIPYNNLTIELDLYHGPLRGLTVAEVEFPSAARSRTFRPPPWFSTDITDDPDFGNISLALHGLPRRLKRRRRPV